MAKCRHDTCYIDTNLFTDDGQQALVPDSSRLCYFHRIEALSLYIYSILEEVSRIINSAANPAVGTNDMTIAMAAAQLQRYNFLELLKIYPSRDIFHENFNKLMFKNNIDVVNVSGFYFPIHNYPKDINFNPSNTPQNWQPKLVLKNYKTYDIDLIDRLINYYENNQFQGLRDIHRTLQNNNENNELLKYGFIDRNGSVDIKFNMQNITFNKDIEIFKSPNSILSCSFVNCTFNSPNIIIESATNIDLSNTTISANNKILDISTYSLSIINSSISSKKVVLSVSYNSLYLDNILNPERLFNKAEDIHIYDNCKITNTNVNQRKSSLKYVDLQKVLFYPYDKDKTIANYQNLEELEFVNCAFMPGHRLREDYLIDKYTNYYEYNYRYLRKHFDDKGDYIEGNDFHYNHMKWKSKALHTNWDRIADKTLIFLYSMANGNNTKPSHAIMSMMFVVVFATVINFLGGTFVIKDIYTKSNILCSINLTDLGYSFLYSLKNLIPLIQSDIFTAKNWVTVLTSMTENILGPLLTALFILAFRNRYRRSIATDELK